MHHNLVSDRSAKNDEAAKNAKIGKLANDLHNTLMTVWKPYKLDTYAASLSRNLTMYTKTFDMLQNYTDENISLKQLALQMHNTEYVEFIDHDMKEVPWSDIFNHLLSGLVLVWEKIAISQEHMALSATNFLSYSTYKFKQSLFIWWFTISGGNHFRNMAEGFQFWDSKNTPVFM